jgi:transcriptional regulator with XRE-family HTH domain
MLIGERLRALREEKNFSQGVIEKRTGLLRCYISRVEIGHTVPAVETLEKFARALEVPMCQLFYDGVQNRRGDRCLVYIQPNILDVIQHKGAPFRRR